MKLGEQLREACSLLGLRIELGFTLALPAHAPVATVARIPELGAKNGMLVFTSYDAIEPFAPEIVQAGYGYSVMREPTSSQVEFDLESFQDMFLDWGWSGDPRARPTWMQDS